MSKSNKGAFVKSEPTPPQEQSTSRPTSESDTPTSEDLPDASGVTPQQSSDYDSEGKDSSSSSYTPEKRPRPRANGRREKGSANLLADKFFSQLEQSQASVERRRSTGKPIPPEARDEEFQKLCWETDIQQKKIYQFTAAKKKALQEAEEKWMAENQ